MKTRLLHTLTALALMTGAGHAATVVTETRLVHAPVTGPMVVDFRQFDGNHDALLSRLEVGEYLFYVFDKDGNELIDDQEFGRPMVLTFAPMKQETVQFIDDNSDGITDRSVVSERAFMQKTGLSQFDPSGQGLSASEFIKTPFKRIDRDLSGQIDVREWKEAYNALLKPLPQNDTFRYND